MGADPNSPDFGVLPPHWTIGNPMENPTIKEAIELMYGDILKKWGEDSHSDPTGLLCFVLPSVVYHSDFLQATIREFPGHPFSAIPVLNNPELL